MISEMKKRVYEILETTGESDLPSRIFDVFIVALISLNLMAVILETVKSLSTQYGTFLRGFEIFSVVIFTIEYVLRVWTCTTNERFRRPIFGRLLFVITLLPVVDLLAILPFYLPMFISFDLRFLRILRLVRIFRMFKMARYFESLTILANVFKAKKEELIITAFIVIILLTLVSSLTYFAENEAQPGTFSSIPQAMWWGIATFSTDGFSRI